jgi:chromosome segregation ATPase
MCLTTVTIRVRRSKLDKYEQDLANQQKNVQERMAEIEKREKELNTKLHRLARKEESLAQKERTIQEKLQDLSQQSRMYEGEQLQGWRTLPTLLSNYT